MNTIAVIFDMDGVIVDTNPYHLTSYQQFLKKYHIEHTEQELIEHMFGKSNSYILQYFFKQELSRADILRYGDEKEALFREIYAHLAEPIAGLLPFIADLKRNGVKTAICTSAPTPNLDLVLQKIPLREQMDSLMSEPDVTQHKPHPEVYLKTSERLGVPPEKCVVFEDSVSGIQAGLAAGMTVVGVTTSHQPHELPPCKAYLNNYEHADFQFIRNLI
jgi:beta-phosphoglucomutase